MESSDGFTAVEAARLAREVDERARSGLRSYAQLTTWAAVFMSAYLAVWVTTVAARPDSDVQPVFMMLPVVIVYSSLIAGARERFAIHLRTRPVDLVVGAMAMMIAGVVVGVGLFGPEIPVWVGVAVGVTALILLGARPVRVLMMSPRTRGIQPTSAPLPRSSRWMTVVVGVLLGIPVAAAPVPMLSAVTMLVVSVPMMVSILVTRSRFSFQRLGLQWGTWQWAGYGTSATIIFGYATCIAFGVGASLPVGVAVSAFVAAATAVTAIAPASQR